MDLGHINKKDHKSLVRTAEKYIDGEGRVRYKGTRALESTQPHGHNKSCCFNFGTKMIFCLVCCSMLLLHSKFCQLIIMF